MGGGRAGKRGEREWAGSGRGGKVVGLGREEVLHSMIEGCSIICRHGPPFQPPPYANRIEDGGASAPPKQRNFQGTSVTESSNQTFS